MTDHTRRDHGSRPDDGDTDGELLAAYLADDLDELEVRRVERRLIDDEGLRRRLDAIHDVVVALQSPDSVTPPDGLEERIRERIAAEAAAPAGRSAAGTRPATSTSRPVDTASAPPWWRRPVAAVAALALLGVVAVSSIAIPALTGGADDNAMTAMSADEAGAQQGAEAAQPEGDGAAAEAAQEAADQRAGVSDSADSAGADSGGAAASGPAAVDPGIAPLVEPSPAGLVEAPPLDDAAQRRDYLAGLAQAPARAALRAATSEESAAFAAQQRTTLRREAGLDDPCVDALVSEDGPAALRLVTAPVDGERTVGVVLPTAGGGLRLQLVDPGGDCTRVVDEVFASDQLEQ